MALPFATVTDLEARWRTLSTAERSRAAALIDDATALILDLSPDVEALASAATLKAIVCAMVKRAMQGPADLDGISQHQQTAGPFQQGVTFANPSGDLYLTKVERKRLLIGTQRAFTVGLVLDPLEACLCAYPCACSSSSSSS